MIKVFYSANIKPIGERQSTDGFYIVLNDKLVFICAFEIVATKPSPVGKGDHGSGG